MLKKEARIGTAAWSIPKDYKSAFAEQGSHLERYAQRLNAVEINTSFYRDHKVQTYERWSATVPDDFQFSVKLSQVFTHVQRLKTGEKKLSENIAAIRGLKEKLGCLLIQLPPSLGFIAKDASAFFAELRTCYEGPVAFEPRHMSWESDEAFRLFENHNISKVIADPEPRPRQLSSLANDLVYYRLHGTPEIYKSNYEAERLKFYAAEIRKDQAIDKNVWCIFDNTTFGYATDNALSLTDLLGQNDHAPVTILNKLVSQNEQI